MTAYRDLPDVGNGYRLIGTTLMDEEQFTVEGWHLYHGEWTARLDGLLRYSQIKRQRREDRINAARTRREADDEFTDYVESLDDAKARYGR